MLVEHGLRSALTVLRALNPDEFASLLYSVPGQFPKLRAALPIYPSPDVQKAWAGNSDTRLLQQTAQFSRIIDQLSHVHRGRGLSGARILDYGCGWGRILRQMLYFTDPDDLFGVDPWHKSIEQCETNRVPGRIFNVHYRPVALPVEVSNIDFSFAFSIFTHLGEENVREVLRCVRAVTAPKGLFVATIRPIEYWQIRRPVLGNERCDELMRVHREGGYAFLPSGEMKNAGSADYGEASCSLEAFETLAREAGWSVSDAEWLLIDPYQQIVCLQAWDAKDMVNEAPNRGLKRTG